MLAEFSGIPFDLLPIMLILVLHRKNFARIREFEQSESGQSHGATHQEDTCTFMGPMRPAGSSLAETFSSQRRMSESSQRVGSSLADDEFQTETISSHDMHEGGYEKFILDKI